MGKIEKYLDYFKLHNQLEDFQEIQNDIENGIRFRGTNLWILITAILIASVGLNMNSTAVVIGAMLISPLMGPINGIGYSVATYNFGLFKASVNSFVFAVVVSLFTSAIYFFISPVSTAHSELLARTSPTIYDVFIAVFGGVAGMLAISSKLKGNVIPGVAIATALMPPICTAGYGLATWQLNFFFGALYLFVINTVFIAFAAMVVARVLKFPINSLVDEKKASKVQHYISIVLLIVTVPSIFFGYQLVKKENFINNSQKFLNDVGIIHNSYLLENQIDAGSGKIQLIYSGYGEKKEEMAKEIKTVALRYHLDSSKIKIVNGADVEYLNKQREQMQSQTDVLNNQLNSTTYELHKALAKLDSVKNIPITGKILLKEMQQLYPDVKSCSYSETYIFPDSVNKVSVVVIKNNNSKMPAPDKKKLENWLQTRLNKKYVRVFYY